MPPLFITDLKMIYWIEDEPEIREIVDLFLGDYTSANNYKVIARWGELPHLNPGDVVVYDLYGVGNPHHPIDQVDYYICSGSVTEEQVHIDIAKPFTNQDIINVLGKYF